MNDTRIEVDLLGERKVPNDCYYGVHTLRALENFTISRGCMNDEPDFIRGMVFVKKASALTNKELGALPGDVADAIVAACDAILDEGRCMDQFPTDSFQGGAGPRGHSPVPRRVTTSRMPSHECRPNRRGHIHTTVAGRKPRRTHALPILPEFLSRAVQDDFIPSEVHQYIP